MSKKRTKCKKQDKKAYNELQKEIEEVVVAIETASNSHLSNKTFLSHNRAVASLVIPNKLYLLWDKKITLQKKLGISVSRHLELVNERIAGTIQANSTAVETRLLKESIR